MLMQNFKTAADLGITEPEQSALIKVLGMLERGDLVDVNAHTRCTNGFNMGTQGHGCGTPACIGGWVAILLDLNQMDYVDQFLPSRRANDGLKELYYRDIAMNAKADQAATALRSYLTTGDARWDLAVA
jgi:hypothetical protein